MKSSISISDRVYLQRVREFFRQGKFNAVSAVAGAAMTCLVLSNAGVPSATVYGWMTISMIAIAGVLVIDRRFKRSSVTIENSRQWLSLRVFAGALVGALYGATPFMLPGSVAIHHEMFLFIIISGMVTLACSGYTLMPLHYLILSGVSMLPLIGYLMTRSDYLHYMLVGVAVLWLVLVLAKALRVSRASIKALFVNEQLVDEANDHKNTKDQLKLLAMHDGLTGLPNRNLLEERLGFMLAQARRHDRSICLMFLDLDGFKPINDLYGHKAGDFALREIAERLESLIRESDIVARLGGDEFILVYTNITDKHNDPNLFAQRVIEAVGKPIVIENGIEIEVGTSIGIALYPDDARDVESLLTNADKAMYSAKNEGKNQYAHAV